MRFTDIYVSRESRYSLGRDSLTGKPYLSIPVSNRKADYEEYYWLSEAELEQLAADTRLASDFAERCGRRELEDRLIVAPGEDRGVH